MLREKTERQLEEVYQSRKQYLNKKIAVRNYMKCAETAKIIADGKPRLRRMRNLACFKIGLALNTLTG